MKKLEFRTTINAKAEKVWDTMLTLDTYREWVAVSWPNSTYKGKWETGEDIKFIGGEGENSGGTKARIVEARKPEYILAKHIAIISSDGSEDSTSEAAKGWVGTTEEYTFEEKDGKTEVKVVMHTSPDWESMFNDGWPNALAKLKEICERKAVAV